VATGVPIAPRHGTAFVSVGGVRLKEALLPVARRIREYGMRLTATEDTAAYLKEHGLRNVRVLHKVSEPDRQPNVLTSLDRGEVDLLLNVPSSLTQSKFERMLEDEYVLRRRCVELGIPLFTSLEAFAAYVDGVRWLESHPVTVEPLYGSEEAGGALPSPRSIPMSRRRRASRRRRRRGRPAPAPTPPTSA